MEKPTKLLLIGAAAASLVVGIGFALSRVENAKVSDLVAICESEKKATQAAPTTAKPWNEPWTEYQKQANGPFDDLLPCDPGSVSYNASGIRKQIYETQRGARNILDVSYSIAVVVLLLACIPHVWYFGLKRLREVANAITGRGN